MVATLRSLKTSLDELLAPAEWADDAVVDQCASTGPSAWSEERLRPTGSGSTSEAVALGHSVLVVPSFASEDECDTLASCAATQVGNAPPNPGNDATHIPGRVRLPTAAWPQPSARALSTALIERALVFAHEHLPCLAAARFGGCSGPPHLTFSPGEPAVNVYTAGGEFAPHEDQQSLTVLVPLNDPRGYEGGGTAFWSDELRAAARSGGPSSFVLRPAPGSALLFTGNVTHAGLPVRAGTRYMYVASFSSQRGYTPHARGTAAAATHRDTAAEPPGVREAALRMAARQRHRRNDGESDEEWIFE